MNSSRNQRCTSLRQEGLCHTNLSSHLNNWGNNWGFYEMLYDHYAPGRFFITSVLGNSYLGTPLTRRFWRSLWHSTVPSKGTKPVFTIFIGRYNNVAGCGEGESGSTSIRLATRSLECCFSFRKIHRPKGKEVTGGWRKLHNEDLHNLYSSNLTPVIMVFRFKV